MNEDMKQYKITLIFPPSLKPDQLDQNIENIKQLITKQGGSFSSSPANPKLQRLSYPINKHHEAFYLTLEMSLPAIAMETVNQQLNLENDLLRHLITLKEKEIIKEKIEPDIDYSKMIEKVEPIVERKPKAKIEDLDKRLEEILNE